MEILYTSRQKNPLPLRCFLLVRCLWESVAVLAEYLIKAKDELCPQPISNSHNDAVREAHRGWLMGKPPECLFKFFIGFDNQIVWCCENPLAYRNCYLVPQLLTQHIHQLTKNVGGNDYSSRALVKQYAESKCFLIVCICINKEGHQPAGISNNQS